MLAITYAVKNNNYNAAFEAAKEETIADNNEILFPMAIEEGKKAFERVNGKAITDTELRKLGIKNIPTSLVSAPKQQTSLTSSLSNIPKLPRNFTGTGIFKDMFNAIYEGDFVNGKLQGKGKHIYLDEIYEGDFVDGIAQPGKAKYTYADGGFYEGDMIDDMIKYMIPNGKGKANLANGNVYDGDFVKGNFHGTGKINYANGDVYEGDWTDGRKNGKGKMTYADGTVQEGRFENGKFVG